MRSATLERNTAETQISLALDLDGTGEGSVNTGCGFLNHMINLLVRHSGFNMKLDCKGDTEVDYHHTTEDIGICLGRAVRYALGDMSGINRYASVLLPMDEALILCAFDISGRGGFYPELQIPTENKRQKGETARSLQIVEPSALGSDLLSDTHSSVTFVEFLTLSMPQFPQLQNRMATVWGCREI